MEIESNIELICQEHGLPIIQVKKDAQESNILYCQKCMEQSYTPIEQLSQDLDNIRIDKIKYLNDLQMKYDQELSNLLKYYVDIRDTYQQQIDTINLIIQKEQELISQEIKLQIDELYQPKKQLTLTQVCVLIKELKNNTTICMDKYKNRVEQLKTQSQKKYQLLIQNLLDISPPQGEEVIQVQQQAPINREQKCQSKVPDQELKYKKKTQKNDDYTYKCQTIALNQEENILATGQMENIVIWEFKKDGQIIFKQKLIEHTKLVTTLCFCQKNLISSGQDIQICIWDQNWKCQQILKGNHTNQINQIVVSNQGDLLISCSLDNSINIWKKDIVDQWQFKQNLKHSLSVLFLSLSPNGRTLVSSGLDGLRIWGRENDDFQQKQMLEKFIQDEQREDKYLKACFANDNEILAQTKQYGHLISLFRNRDSQFQPRERLDLSAISQDYDRELLFSPLFFNSQSKVIVCRQSKKATFIIQQRQDGKYQIQQKLNGDFRASAITNNGYYLILQESNEGSIQIWHQK